MEWHQPGYIKRLRQTLYTQGVVCNPRQSMNTIIGSASTTNSPRLLSPIFAVRFSELAVHLTET